MGKIKIDMNLTKFDENIIYSIKEKNIYLYKRSEAYLLEFKQKYPELIKNVKGLFDENKRLQGDFDYLNRNWHVMDIDEIDIVNDGNSILIIMDGYYLQAFENIKNIENLKIDTVYYFLNQASEIEYVYRDKYKTNTLENIIVFRSGPQNSSYVKGMDFSDNARALFEYMIFCGYEKKYELVWVVNNPEEYKEKNYGKNVKFISWHWAVSENSALRDEYYRVVCLAKYFFFTDAYGFSRMCRQDQIRVQLWHGCGFKTRVNFVPCEKRYEYNIVISEKYKEIHKEIYGLRDDQVLITGYPKEDLLFHPVSREKLKQLGIPDGKKYLFWLPTFRTASEQLQILNEHAFETEIGLPIIYRMNDLEKMNQILFQNDIVMVIKLHPFQKKESISCGHLSNIVLLENEQLVELDIQVNELLGWADALISDYSSAAIDYLILNRPIAFTLDDVEEYRSSRGFVFDNIREWLPGKEIFSVNDFLNYIEEIGKDIDSAKEKREAVRNVLHQFNDDESSKRVLEALKIEK